MSRKAESLTSQQSCLLLCRSGPKVCDEVLSVGPDSCQQIDAARRHLPQGLVEVPEQVLPHECEIDGVAIVLHLPNCVSIDRSPPPFLTLEHICWKGIRLRGVFAPVACRRRHNPKQSTNYCLTWITSIGGTNTLTVVTTVAATPRRVDTRCAPLDGAVATQISNLNPTGLSPHVMVRSGRRLPNYRFIDVELSAHRRTATLMVLQRSHLWPQPNLQSARFRRHRNLRAPHHLPSRLDASDDVAYCDSSGCILLASLRVFASLLTFQNSKQVGPFAIRPTSSPIPPAAETPCFCRSLYTFSPYESAILFYQMRTRDPHTLTFFCLWANLNFHLNLSSFH